MGVYVNWCSRSGGELDIRVATQATMLLTTSVSECIASPMIASDPVVNPTAIFARRTTRFIDPSINIIRCTSLSLWKFLLTLLFPVKNFMDLTSQLTGDEFYAQSMLNFLVRPNHLDLSSKYWFLSIAQNFIFTMLILVKCTKLSKYIVSL